MNLPPVREAPCFDCPWRRNATRGWLGPYDAETWEAMAHGEVAIACHITIPDDSIYGDWDNDPLLQCAGAAIYRSNVGKLPRNHEVATLPADRQTVFGYGEFVEYHNSE